MATVSHRSSKAVAAHWLPIPTSSLQHYYLAWFSFHIVTKEQMENVTEPEKELAA